MGQRIFLVPLSLVAVIVALALLEGGCQIYLRLIPHSAALTTFYPGLQRGEGGLPAPGLRQYASEVRDRSGKMVSRTEYHLDNHQRRETYDPSPGKRKDSFLALFGCSYTMGEGVRDEETLPSELARLFPKTRVYNYGFHGFGPANAVWRLEHLPLRREIPESNGTGIYVYIDDQFRRVTATMSYVAGWGRAFPYYEADERGELHDAGSFEKAHPLRTRLYDMLSSLALLRLFQLDLPLSRPPTGAKLVALHLKAIRDRFQREYPGQRFFVLFFPRSEFSWGVREHLVRLGVEIIDYAGLEVPWTRGQPHPPAETYRVVAERLAQDLTPRSARLARSAELNMSRDDLPVNKNQTNLRDFPSSEQISWGKLIF